MTPRPGVSAASRAAGIERLGVLLKKIDGVLDRHNLLGGIVGDFTAELALEGHGQFYRIKTVGAQVIEDLLPLHRPLPRRSLPGAEYNRQGAQKSAERDRRHNFGKGGGRFFGGDTEAFLLPQVLPQPHFCQKKSRETQGFPASRTGRLYVWAT